MIYVYIWFETAGWSHTAPFEQDQLSVADGELLILQMRDIPSLWGTTNPTPLQECRVGEIEETGEKYHFAI